MKYPVCTHNRQFVHYLTVYQYIAATNERAREKSTPRDFHRFESQTENTLLVVLLILTVHGSQPPLACSLLNRL